VKPLTVVGVGGEDIEAEPNPPVGEEGPTVLIEASAMVTADTHPAAARRKNDGIKA
jgi:hypothetical protein